MKTIEKITYLATIGRTGSIHTAGKCHGREFMAFDWCGTDTCHGVCLAFAMALHKQSISSSGMAGPIGPQG
jgi:hypothetical protein